MDKAEQFRIISGSVDEHKYLEEKTQALLEDYVIMIKSSLGNEKFLVSSYSEGCPNPRYIKIEPNRPDCTRITGLLKRAHRTPESTFEKACESGVQLALGGITYTIIFNPQKQEFV